jgi:eukaryotic-like serine/threonine-protein kinase
MQDASEFEKAGVAPGDVLAGKYRIERIIGVGGMGVVVAAHHLQLDERVAIKFLLPEALLNAEVVARFGREARAAVKIKSEHVARVSDVGTLETGSPYMVMEYLAGHDLSSWLQQKGPLPILQTVEFILQACEAIAEAHVLGIVHRDLKPANLFCIRRADGIFAIKVLDFGISKVTSQSGAARDAQMTKTSAVFGSPLYMSPEQMLSARDVDARTDIWALGAILYELLTGKSPFEGETLPEVYARISTLPPLPLRDRRPDVPAELEAVILKCLEKDRNCRFSNVADLALALAKFGPKRALSSVDRICRIIQTLDPGASVDAPPPASDATLAVSGPDTRASWGHTAPEAKRGIAARLVVLLAGFALVASAGVAFAVLRQQSAKSPDKPPIQAATLAGVSAAVAPGSPSPVGTSTQANPLASVGLPVEVSSATPAPSELIPVQKPPNAVAVRRQPSTQRGASLASVATTPAQPLASTVPVPVPARKGPAAWMRTQY